MPDPASAERRALLHIGTHKTGTTSFQIWARDSARELRNQRGVSLYAGRLEHRHAEFSLLCVRPNRTLYVQQKFPEWSDEAWRKETCAQIRQQCSSAEGDVLVSDECLSQLRYEDELERIAELVEPRPVRVVVCLRDPAAYLASYRAMMERRGEPPSTDVGSHAYVEPDSWLVDYDQLLGVYRKVFGADAVASFRYEDAMAEWGSTIPGVLNAFGIDVRGLPSWYRYHENVWSRPPSLARRIRTRAGAVKHKVVRRGR